MFWRCQWRSIVALHPNSALTTLQQLPVIHPPSQYIFGATINVNPQKHSIIYPRLSFPLATSFHLRLHLVSNAEYNYLNIPGDITTDGTMQLIITTSISNLSTSPPIKLYSTIIYRTSNCGSSNCHYQFYQLKNSGLINMTSPPSLINFAGNRIGFLTFQGQKRYISIQNQNNYYIKKNFSEFLNGNSPSTYNLVTNHFSSNIDFTGDCTSDLVLLSKSSTNKSILQFYQKQTNSKLIISKYLQFNQKNIIFFTFVDLDDSGTVDLVLVVQDNGYSNISVIYNSVNQRKQICQTYPQFPFDIKNMRTINMPYNISSYGPLIFGDINSDSYPDLLTIATQKTSKRVLFLLNTQTKGQQQFSQVTGSHSNLILQSINPKQVAFFDFGQDGKLDIFVMLQSDNSNNITITRTCFFNNIKDDTLFIKILPLSQSSDYQIGSNRLSNAFGITIQWRITKLDGNKKISLLNQKSQWNYNTLQLPFVCGGLGRTNNYVQDLTVGYEGPGQKMDWSPIIPDSKLLVYQQNGDWKLQTLLTNSQRVNQVIYVSIVILAVLGIIIIILNFRENKEDRRDQYNFIQLIH